MQKYLLFLSFIILSACSDKSPTSADNQVAIKATNQSATQSAQQEFSKPKTPENPIEYSDLTEFKILSITEGLYENTPALQINLTLPIANKQNVAQLLSVTKNDEKVAGHWLYNDSQATLYFPFIEAETSYNVVVSKDLLSVNGKKIATGKVQKITTQAYKKNVRFISKGSTLLKDSNILPIEAVNVDAVDMKFWRIHEDKYVKFLNMSYLDEIYSLEKMHKIADLVYTSQFALDSIKNKREKHNISINNIDVVQESGLYLVTMNPKNVYSYKFATTWFMSTDIGLHTRMYKDSIVAFTHKIPQAEVYPNIEISVLDAAGMQLATAVTDEQGFAELQLSNLDKAALLIAKQGGNFNLIRLQQAKMDLSEFNLVARKHHAQELFLYAPRNLYRPGETVNINGLLRNYDGNFVQASPIKVQIKRPDNRVMKTFNWQGDESSLYESEFTIASDAMTGMWTFSAQLANKDSFEYQFAIEDFLPERLKLDLQPANQSEHITATDIPTIKVQSDYLYGAPAANNRFDATVSVSPASKLFDYKDFVFGSKSYRDYQLFVDIPAQNLDADGFAELKLKNDWQKTKFPLKITSFVNVYESGGRPISRKISHTVWPQSVAIGVRPLWDGDFASPQSNNELELIAINQQGVKLDMQNVDVLLIRENSQRYWQWGDDGWSYSNSAQNVAVFNSIVNLTKDTKSIVNLPVDYGNYRVEIRHQQQLISSYQFFSGWNWYDAASASGQRPDQVKLEWLADNVTSGNDVELKITAPYAGTALLTIESDKILYKQSITMSSAEQTISIPVSQQWDSHNIYASVMVIRKGQTQGKVARQHLPARSFGILHLPLNRTNRQLDIAIQNPAKILPETKVKIKIKAHNLDVNKETFVTLAAVDTGVLSISNFETPNPFTWFFAKRQYLAAVRDIYSSIISLGTGKNATQKFGGDGDMNRGGDAPANAVQIVSLFAKKVKFNADGIADIELQIPYFNGKLRLMAMAFNDNQFAGVESHIIVAAPIVVSASMPRFIAKEDKSFVTIDISNTEDFAQTIKLDLTADRALGAQTSKHEMQLQAKEQKVIKLPLLATVHSGIGSVNVAAVIAGKNSYSLDRSWTLGIRPAFPAITVATSAVLEHDKTFTATQSSLAKFDQANLKSIFKVSNIPVLNADEHLQQLLQYPYGCLEQTASRVWSLLDVEEADFALFAADKQHEIFLKRGELIEAAISRILGMQRYDGSFGLWNNNSHEEKWLTTYVIDLLLNAKKLGYNVPERALNKAIKRLRTYIQGSSSRVNSDLARYLQDKKHYVLAYQAYAVYVLAGIKQVNLQDVRNLYDKNSEHAKRSLPLAHLAMALEILGDERRANDAWLKAFDFDTSANNHYYADYGSSIRDIAQIILLSNQSHLTKSLAKTGYSLILPLQQSLQTRSWLSTQERGALFRLAKSLQKNKSKDVKWSAVLARNNSQDDYLQSHDLLKVWYQQDAKTGFSLTNTSEKPLFVDFKTQGYLQNSEAQSNGINVVRKYFDSKGNDLDISKLSTGDLVLVHLTVTLDKQYDYLPDAMLVELLPAGLELENQNLEHAFKIDDIKIGKNTILEWQKQNKIKHSEYRDDRFMAAISLSRYQPTQLFYLARVVTPGEYTIPPTLIEDMYRPEIRAIGKSIGKMVIMD